MNAARVGATALTVVSLAALGWRAFHPPHEPVSSATEATLWTAGAETRAATRAPNELRSGVQLALADATSAPVNAQRVPDAAFVRRNFPRLRDVTIVGDGVEPADSSAFQGLTVTWREPANRIPTTAIVALAAPRTLTVGQAPVIQGKIAGGVAGGNVTMTVDGPDAKMETTELTLDDRGEAVFSLTGSATRAAGAFEWVVRAGHTELLRVGISVRAPELPRVLLLQASPAIEFARLQRWLASLGSRVTMRTRVSAERYRFTTANGAPEQFNAIDRGLLSVFDVVVTTERALAELTSQEQAAVADEGARGGLGVLVIGEAASGVMRTLVAVGRISGEGADEESGEKRLARIRLSSGAELGEPALVLPAKIVAEPLQRWLVRDAQERTVAAAWPRGRGWNARSIVADAWRWQQSGHEAEFAAYWSHLLSAIGQRTEPVTGAWRIENPDAMIFAGDAVRLAWHGPPKQRPRRGIATDPQGETVPLNLAPSTDEAGRAGAVFWPVRAGWHEVEAADGAKFAFLVQPRDAQPQMRAERKRAVTARLVANSPTHRTEPVESSGGTIEFCAAYAWFVLFVCGVGWLWLQERRSATAVTLRVNR